MLTGDAEGPAISVADSIGLPRDDVHAALLPEDKLTYVSFQSRSYAFVNASFWKLHEG